MTFNFGTKARTDLMGTNFELNSKAIALHFDDKLENFYDVSTWTNNCNGSDWKEF